MKIFLDSGAFSVWNSKREIDLDAYIHFAKKYIDDIDVIATLDVIPGEPNKKLTVKDVEQAAEKGYSNYEKMLKAGIPQEKLLHTFHQGDPPIWLERLVNEGGYIGVSPANDKTTSQRRQWMDNICCPILLNGKGEPKVKFHGFAVTSLKLVFNYPWTSVDSSSWTLRGGGYGLIDLPSNIAMKKKSDFYVKSIPISKGVKKYKDDGNKKNGFFSVDRISQKDASFIRNPMYLKSVNSFLGKYGFSLDTLSDNAYLRAIWNAIYLMQAVKKFTSTTLYLASNDLTSVKLLSRKIRELNLDLDINILVSFAAIANKNNESNTLNRLVNMKHKYTNITV